MLANMADATATFGAPPASPAIAETSAAASAASSPGADSPLQPVAQASNAVVIARLAPQPLPYQLYVVPQPPQLPHSPQPQLVLPNLGPQLAPVGAIQLPPADSTQLPPAGSIEEVLGISVEEAFDMLSETANLVSEADNPPPTARFRDAGHPARKIRRPPPPPLPPPPLLPWPPPPGPLQLPSPHAFRKIRLLEEIPSVVAPKQLQQLGGDDNSSSCSSCSIYSEHDDSSVATLSVDGDEEDDLSLQVGDSRYDDSIQQGPGQQGILPRVAAAARSDRGAQSSSHAREPTCAVANEGEVGEVDTQAGRGERWEISIHMCMSIRMHLHQCMSLLRHVHTHTYA